MGQQALTILLTAVVLGAGVWLGATFFVEATRPMASPDGGLAREPAAPRSDPVAQPALESGSDLASALRRIQALETKIRALEAEIAKTRPLVEMYEDAKAHGPIPVGGVPVPERPGAPAVLLEEGDHEASAQLSQAMKLEGKRAKAFKDAHARFLKQIEALEKQNAEVKVDGDTTTITIKPFGAAADDLVRDWNDWKRDNWTADEVKAYKNNGGDNVLFGARLGQHKRTVKIREAAGNIQVTDSNDANVGFPVHISGPADARELVLEDYTHLLK